MEQQNQENEAFVFNIPMNIVALSNPQSYPFPGGVIPVHVPGNKMIGCCIAPVAGTVKIYLPSDNSVDPVLLKIKNGMDFYITYFSPPFNTHLMLSEAPVDDHSQKYTLWCPF